MLRRSSYAAASLERPRLVAPHVLLGIGALVGVLLVLLYPYQALVQYTINATRGDTLTVAYLRNLLRTDPRNPELRLALVRQSLARRDYEQARADLAPLLANGVDRDTLTEARWVDWTLYEASCCRRRRGRRATSSLRRSCRSACAMRWRSTASTKSTGCRWCSARCRADRRCWRWT